MNVNTPQKNNHLLAWILLQAKKYGFQDAIYSLKAVIDSGLFYLMLKNIDEQYFGSINTQQQSMTQTFKLIDEYLIKQFGKRFKISFRNKLVNLECIEDLIKILLFCCLHSKKKQQYIQRIFQLSQSIQSSLMDAIQLVNSNLINIVNQNDILLRVQQLQNQIEQLKAQISISCIKQMNSKKIIQQLQEQLLKRNKQIRLYKTQKQKVMQALDLSTFQQYLALFQRLQQQNKILNRYVEQLEDSNIQLQQSQKQLTKNIENQSSIIVDLSDNITNLKQKITTLKLQASSSYNKLSLEDTISDVTRSFGADIANINGNKENFVSAKKKHRRIDSLDCWEQASSQSQKYNQRQMQLLEEMKQLRKYNSDLIQKIETVYKTLNNLTQQISHIKQKNQSLTKQNKFYKKQIGSLKKLQERMEIDLCNGVI